MAWRIEESVIRGEIDNRTRGRVTGRIWFAGRAAPVELELTGNAWRDLAGRRLEFVNPAPKPGDLGGLAAKQTGVIGDCTASRKVKVPEIPLDQIGEYYAARKPWPWHWGNSLYLEWYSETNGRVVIESASFTLTIAEESTWEMSEAGEEEQRRANAEELGNFMKRLSDAAPAGEVVEDTAWNVAAAAQTEAEAEEMAEESERLVDRIQARMEREGPDADLEKIVREELERRARERGEAPPTPEEETQRAEWTEAANRAAEEAAGQECGDGLDFDQPLAKQCFALAVRLMKEPEERGWLPADAGEEHPLVELGAAAAKAGTKLAGALHAGEWPPGLEFCASAIVRLKRAREFLDDALRAADSCAEEKLGEEKWLAEVSRELRELAEACDALIAELRAKLERGCD